MPNALANSVKDMDWDAAQVPSHAVHVVLNVVYTNPDHGSGRRSVPRDTQENIVDATFLGDNGKPIQGISQLYKVMFVRQWISRKGNRNIIFSKLLPPNQKISNDYIYTK